MTKIFCLPVRTRILLSAATFALLPAAAQAQDASAAATAPQAPGTAESPAAAPTPDAASSNDSGDIVVTARFRNETLNSVPIAITALKGDALAVKNLNNLQDISQTVPTVDFRAGASNKDRTVFIRGLGTITTSPGVEPSVSTVLDGVVLGRPGQSTLDLVDVDRIEVLRGPQGTLFGKNASAGVINIVSKDPTDQEMGTAEASYYQGNEYRFKLGLSGPISDKLLYDITGLYGHYDGNVRNLVTGDKVNGYSRKGGRGKLVWKPTDTLTFHLNGDYLYTRDKVPTGVFAKTSRVAYPTGVVTPNPALAAKLAAAGVTPGLDNRTVAQNFDSDVRDKNYGVSLQGDLALGDYTVTSITAYRGWRNVQHQDFDMLNAPDATFPQAVDTGRLRYHQFSQEVRLTSPKGGFIDYVVGAYYLHSVDDERYERDLTRIVAAAPVNNTGVALYGTKNDNYSAFGEANINFTRRLRAIAGGRVIHDKLSFYHNRVADTLVALTGIQPNFGATGDTSHTGYSARGGLQYDLPGTGMVYATYSRGYKGPAYNVFFNMLARDTIALKPETSDSYEVGFKGSLFDHKLQITLDGFYAKYHNYQANFTDQVGNPPAIITRLINAGTVTTKGVEGDITAHPFQPLVLSFNFARTTAKVDHFNCPAGAPVSCDVDGQPLPFAPKWKLHSDATWTQPMTDKIDLLLNTDYSWKSRTQYSLSETPDTIQPSYGIWNASIGIAGKGDSGAWRLTGVVKNITNKHYSSYLMPGSLAGVVRFVPRDDHRYFGVSAFTEF
jgi:iron complex outermembrane recepter protein